MEVREIVGYSTDEFANALEVMESSIAMGEQARITICTEGLLDEAGLAEMYLEMVATGCHLSYPTARVVDGVPTTEFVLQKGSPQWQIIIPILVPLFTIGLIAFGIFKLESISSALMPLMLVTIGGVIIMAALLQKPAMKYIERGGTIPGLPQTTKRPDILQQQAAYYRELSTMSPKPGWVKALKEGRDPFSGWEYPKGTWVICVCQDMFEKELPSFLKNQFVLPWSYEEMVKEMAHYYRPKKEKLLYQPSTSKKAVAAR